MRGSLTDVLCIETENAEGGFIDRTVKLKYIET
jgi:hypothetical protein